jgi:ankyrin repeat protein
LRDSKGFTALHVALLNNNTEVVYMLLNFVRLTYIRETAEAEDVLRELVNFKTSEGFTCVHYAAFKGNLVRTTQPALKVILEET